MSTRSVKWPYAVLLLAVLALLFFSEDVEANEAPTASIDSVTPDPAYQNIPADFKSIDNTTVGYWSFDEGNGTLAYDSTDFGNNGSLSGDVNWVNGWQSDHALSFDGDNDYVTVPDDDSLDMEEDFSIFAWVNCDEGHSGRIVYKYGSGTGRGYYLSIYSSANPVLHGAIIGSSTGGITGTTDLCDGEWHHVGFTRDADGYLNLYVDGKFDASPVSSPSGDLSNGQALFIGVDVVYQNDFQGKIDEVAVWNQLLSIDDISKLHSLTYREYITFNGSASDDDGTITNYFWSSSLDGNLSSSQNFTFEINDLSAGNHTISFKVQDNNGTWSDEVSTYLTVKSFPTANVVSISPNPAPEGTQVNYTGTGTDPDGNIVGYQWRSSLDGVLSANASFSNSSLSYGNHSIYFKVRDNESLWSEEVLAYLYVNAKPVANIDFILPFEAYQNPGTFDSNLSVWRYVRAMSLDPVTPIDNYHVKVQLTNTTFNYSRAAESGNDIRFYDGERNELQYWIEGWDNTTNSTIWVYAVNAGTKNVYMFYGSPDAESKSNISIFNSYSEQITKGGWGGNTYYLNYPVDNDIRVLSYQSKLTVSVKGDLDGTGDSNEYLRLHHNGNYHGKVGTGGWNQCGGYKSPVVYSGSGYPTYSTYIGAEGILEIKMDIGSGSSYCQSYARITLSGYSRNYTTHEPNTTLGPEIDILGDTLLFLGTAYDWDGNITHRYWNSSIDGILGTENNLTLLTSELSYGNHALTFEARSENGIWSDTVHQYLVVKIFPTATIEFINPSNADEGNLIEFSGSGNDPDGTITAHAWWSSIDGLFGTNSSFFNSSLSYGNHTITLRVMDNESFWSLNATKFLVINSVPSVEINSIDPDPAYQGEGNLFSIMPENLELWKYQRKINLSNSTPESSYQVRIEIDQNNFDYAHVNSSGNDIRFYDIYGDKLNYWIQLWNNSGKSILWINITSADTSEFLMYYGNDDALPESNGSATFPIYFDFETGDDGWVYSESDWQFKGDRDELETNSQNYVLRVELPSNKNIEAGEYAQYSRAVAIPNGTYALEFSEADGSGSSSTSTTIVKRFFINNDYLYSEYIRDSEPAFNWTSHEIGLADYSNQEITLRWRLYLRSEVWNAQSRIYLDWAYVRKSSDQNVTASLGNEISSDNVQLIGSATDLDGIITQYSWNSSLDGVIGTERNLSIDPDLLSFGIHNITFTARDDLGSWAPEVSGQLTVKSFPIATIESITPNPVPFGEPTLFSGSGNDPDGTIVSYLWWSDLDGILSTSTSFTTSSLSNGNHTIFFNVQDNEGLWGKEVSFQLRVNLIPTAAIQSSDDWLTEGDTFSAAGSASDADGEVIEHQWISSNDGIIADTQSVAYDGLSNGTHQITYRVMDNDGHWSLNDSTTVTVNGIPRITGLDYPQLINEGGTAFFNLSYYDDDYVDEFEWISDRDGLIGSSASFQRETGTVLTNGTHDITVRVRDNFGVWSEYSHITMRVNGIPRTEPLVELSHFLIEGDSVNLTINAADDVQVASIEWDVDGTVSTGNDYLLLDSLANGSHTVRVRANDGDGVWSSYTVFTLFVNGIPRGAIIEPPEVWLTGDELVIQGIGSDDGEELVFRWVYLNDTYFGESITIVHSASESVKISLTLIDEYNTSSSESNWTTLFHHRPTATIVSADTVSNHTVLQVVGEGNDDGTITMYHWVSDVDGSLGVGPSLSFYSMSVGYRNVSLTVKDNHEIWSYPVSTQVYIDDGDNQFPPADLFPFDPTQWFDRDGDGWGDNPKGNHSDAFPDDPTEWLDTDGDGIGDNTDLFVSVPNNYVYASVSLVVLAGAAVILESRTRGNLDNLRSELQSVIDAGLNRKVATAALESLDDVGGIYLLSAEIRTARRAVREGRKHERDVVAIMEQMTALRNDIAAMKAENIDAAEYRAILEELELALVQQSQENPSYEYIANLQEKWVEQEGEE